MNRSTFVTLGRRALQLGTLFLAVSSVSVGGENAASSHGTALIGQMVVTAVAERPLMGHIVVTAEREQPFIGELVVTAERIAPAELVADLGSMTVTAHRLVTLAEAR